MTFKVREKNKKFTPPGGLYSAKNQKFFSYAKKTNLKKKAFRCQTKKKKAQIWQLCSPHPKKINSEGKFACMCILPLHFVFSSFRNSHRVLFDHCQNKKLKRGALVHKPMAYRLFVQIGEYCGCANISDRSC